MFKTLFTDDDQCDLGTENPDNIAETGIDVIAKPKGKRPSSSDPAQRWREDVDSNCLIACYLLNQTCAVLCILDEVEMHRLRCQRRWKHQPLVPPGSVITAKSPLLRTIK